MTQPAAAAPVTLLVVDDHTLFRRGLIALLGRTPACMWWVRQATPPRP